MTLVELFLLLFAAAGMTFTIVHAEIMDILGIRPFLNKNEFLKKLTHCSLCTGTWVGAFLGIFYVSWALLLPFIFASAAFSFIFERTTILLDEKILKAEEERKKG